VRTDACCVPDICNFPILDAIVPKNVGLQFTIALTHEVSNAKLSSILKNLGTTEGEFSIIFVVPEYNMGAFKFPSNLGKCKLYVTSPECNSREVLIAKLSKKRDASDAGLI